MTGGFIPRERVRAECAEPFLDEGAAGARAAAFDAAGWEVEYRRPPEPLTTTGCPDLVLLVAVVRGRDTGEPIAHVTCWDGLRSRGGNR